MLDLAVEFLIDSHAVYWDDCYTKRQIVSATKSKALEQLQLSVSHSQSCNTYEMALATKMHYAAEVRRISVCGVSIHSLTMYRHYWA